MEPQLLQGEGNLLWVGRWKMIELHHGVSWTRVWTPWAAEPILGLATAALRGQNTGRGGRSHGADGEVAVGDLSGTSRQGELAYQWSPEANRAVFYPRVVCPYSGSDRLEWRVSTGLGTVYATTVTYPFQGDALQRRADRLRRRLPDDEPGRGDRPDGGARSACGSSSVSIRPGGDQPAYPVFIPAERRVMSGLYAAARRSSAPRKAISARSPPGSMSSI